MREFPHLFVLLCVGSIGLSCSQKVTTDCPIEYFAKPLVSIAKMTVHYTLPALKLITTELYSFTLKLHYHERRGKKKKKKCTARTIIFCVYTLFQPYASYINIYRVHILSATFFYPSELFLLFIKPSLFIYICIYSYSLLICKSDFIQFVHQWCYVYIRFEST